MSARRDPRAEPDGSDPSEVAEHHVDYGVRRDPESARRLQPPASRSRPDLGRGAGAIETSDLIDLPPESPAAPESPRYPDSPRYPESPRSQRRAEPAAASSPERGSVRPPPQDKSSVRPPPQISYRPPIEASGPVTRRASGSAVVTSIDPRLEQIEPIIDEGNWHTVARQLGSLEESGRLPPTLGLVAAVAHTEIAGEAGSPEASDLGIRCVAGLFGVSPESAVGRVLAKRMLRRNPRPTEGAGATMALNLSLVLMAMLLVAGLIGGYVIGSGMLKLPARLPF